MICLWLIIENLTSLVFSFKLHLCVLILGENNHNCESCLMNVLLYWTEYTNRTSSKIQTQLASRIRGAVCMILT
jgi:hypothetical protein